jgi:hypothetical protein
MAKRNNVIKYCVSLVIAGFSLFEMVPKLFSFLEDDLSQTKKRACFLLIMYGLSALFVCSLWINIQIMFLLGLLSLKLSPLLAVFLMTLTTIMLLLLTLFIISKQRVFSFARTRLLIKAIAKIKF